MSDQAPNLMKHRPFQLAWAFDVLCMVAGVAAYFVTDNVYFIVGLVLLGSLPMVFVMVRFSKANAAGAAKAADSSKDIVQ